MYLNSYSTPSSLWLACALSEIKFPLIYDSRHGSRDKGGIQCNAGQRLKDTSVCPKKIASLIFTKKSSPYSLALETTMTARVIFPSATFIRSTRAMKTNIWHLNSPPGIDLFDRISPEMSRVCEYISSRCLSAQTHWFDIQKCKIFPGYNVKCKCIKTNSYFQKSKLFEGVL